VILDEATSHLDAASEARIRDASRALLAGRTALVISHRHRLAAIADQVAVIEHGRVARLGPPAAILGTERPERPDRDRARPAPAPSVGPVVGPTNAPGSEGVPA
jgi:ABC-type multidrug transport system ATPase subunit